jgi:hypothetical protein
MNRNEEAVKDPLREFIDQDLIEKAPAGFTEKIMSGIQAEQRTEAASIKKRLISVPVIAATVTVLLILTAVLLGGAETTIPVLKLPQTIKITLPELNLSKVFSTSLPVVSGYIVLAFLALGFFDKALFNIFKRKGHA